MSFRDCYERTEASCATDNACVLEYDTNNRFPSCVPRLDRVFEMDLSQDDLSLFRTVLVRLLPPAPHTELGKTRVIVALREMFQEMKPRIDLELRNLGRTHETWQSLVTTVSTDILKQIQEYECAICISEINDSPPGTPITALPCNHIYHRRCMRDWLKSDGRGCPTCRTAIDADLTNEINGVVATLPQLERNNTLTFVTFCIIIILLLSDTRFYYNHAGSFNY